MVRQATPSSALAQALGRSVWAYNKAADPQDGSALPGVPSMFDSLEVKVLYLT